MARKFFSKEDRERHLRQRSLLPEQDVPKFIASAWHAQVMHYLKSRTSKLSLSSEWALLRRQDVEAICFYLEKFGGFSKEVMADVFEYSTIEVQLLVLEKVKDSTLYEQVDANKALAELDPDVLRHLIPHFEKRP